MYKDPKRKSKRSKIPIDRRRKLQELVFLALRVALLAEATVALLQAGRASLSKGTIREATIFLAAGVVALLASEVLARRNNRTNKEKSKNISSLRKFGLISLPVDYVGELKVLEKRLQRSGLPGNKIRQIMKKSRRDMCRGYLKCQLANWLDNFKHQIMQYWISK